MAIFRKIHTIFWSDPFIQSLSPERKYFYLYLLTNDKTRQCGIYEITKKQISYDTGYNMDTVSILLNYFADTRKIAYSTETSEIAIKNWNKYNDNKSPKTQILVKQEIAKVKDKSLIQYLYSTDTVPILHRQEEEEREEEEEQELEGKKYLLIEMKEIFENENKNYLFGEKDIEGLRGFAKTIAAQFNIKNGIEFWTEPQLQLIKERWKAWTKIIISTNTLCNKSLEELNRFKKTEIANIEKNGTHQQSNSGSSSGKKGTSEARIEAARNWGRTPTSKESPTASDH